MVQLKGIATECVLGLDMGTSGLKGVLLSLSGTIEAVTTVPYDYSSPEPGWAESDPSVWETAAKQAIRQLAEQAPTAQIVAIGLDGQLHGTVLADVDGHAVAPAVLWPDTRSIDVIRQRWSTLPETLLASLGNPLAPGMPGPVLSWIAEYQPEVYGKAVRFMSPKDWLRSRLIPGSFVTDPSDASATLLWDVPRQDWNWELVERLGLRPSLLPLVHPSGSSAGNVPRSIAEAWGIPYGIPVSVGAGDVPATLKAIDDDSVAASLILGSGAQAISMRTPDKLEVAPRFHVFRAPDSRTFSLAAPMNGGLALERVRGLLGMGWGELYDSPFLSLSSVDPVFLPFFIGERAPEPIPPQQAAWVELGVGATRETLAASAVEGMLFGMRRCLEAIPMGDGPIQIVGGGSSDRRVQQLAADVLGRTIIARNVPHATALGAAALGFEALDALGDSAPIPIGDAVVSEPLRVVDERYERFTAAANAVVSSHSAS